jgi:MFS family permease
VSDRILLGRLVRSLGWWSVIRQGGPGRTLSIVALTDAFGTALFAGTVAILLTTTTRLTVTEVGLGLSIGGLAGILAAVPAGALADRLGPKRFLVTAAVGSTLGYALYPTVHSLLTLSLLASFVAICAAGVWPAQQALLGTLLPEAERVTVIASTRAVRNVGYAAAGLAVSMVLTLGGHGALWVAAGLNALTFALAAALIARLPATPRGRRDGKRRYAAGLRDLRYVLLMLLSTVYALTLVLLDVGIPLWVVIHTAAPRAVAGIVLTVNTVLVVLLQVRFAKGIDTPRAAIRGLRRATGFFVLAFGCIALASPLPAVAATVVILGGAILLTFGEMLESSSWWTVSYELAPETSRTEHLAVFSLNYPLAATLGPILVTAVVAHGWVGWCALMLLFGLAGLTATPLVRAIERTRDRVTRSHAADRSGSSLEGALE